MRQWLIIVFLFLILRSFSQIPVPQLCAVSVDTALNRPVLMWTIQDIAGIDGFIIKRIIWNGSGVLDGTLNNVAVLADAATRRFVDTTTTYNTHADPTERSEKYVVVAYRDTAGRQVYSGFSQMLSSIHLSAYYDSCSTKIKLIWTTNQQIEQYSLYLITPTGLRRLTTTRDTQFVYNPTAQGNYRFIIKARLANNCLRDTILSNIATVHTGLFERPNLLYIQGVTAVGDDSLLLGLHIDLPQDKPLVSLWMDASQVAQFTGDYDGDYLLQATANTKHNFVLKAQSGCGQLIDSSNVAHNLVLAGNYSQAGQQAIVALQWNSYDYAAGQPESYDVYFSVDGHSFSLVNHVNDTVAEHVLNNLIASEVVPSTLYYYVEGTQRRDTLVGQVMSVRSNVVKVMPPPLLVVPNAINPKSPDPRDRVFLVQLDFVDSYELTIVDRYGRVVYHSTNVGQGWDGRDKNGNYVPVDTYFYLLKYTSHGKKYKFRGSISVIY